MQGIYFSYSLQHYFYFILNIYIFTSPHTMTTLIPPSRCPGFTVVDDIEFSIAIAPDKYSLCCVRSVVLRSNKVTCWPLPTICLFIYL